MENQAELGMYASVNQARPPFVPMMACRLFRAKLLSELMVFYC